ncbi:TonB-dependent receptor [Colwellia sp. 20A7]|uniref:TonB-dependent receptor n=1 Tax=Colwellia sp. 20A7 TaxID=2689569 RepID=UPI00135701E6|nr:TonB-dependent receptor [Colwellia sp. 20A7]
MKRRIENKFTKTVLSIAVAAAFGTTSVNAQEEAVAETEVITVTGVRSSLAESLANKKDARSLVDSIAAEELGRFPDDNVADSLSHIPGLTVSRTRGGEAQHVNVRGLGPEFTIVTLNNRILATDDGGRNFAFDVIPSEMISGADVWKTVQAKNIEGSIGGAVNLKSARPFANPGMQGAASVTADYNDYSEEMGTKFNGVFSNTFADDTLGFIIGLSTSEGTERADDMFDNNVSGVDDEVNYDINKDGVITDNEKNLVIPRSYALGSYATEFKRTGITSALQWQPTERLVLTADFLMTKLEADSSGFAQSFYMADDSTGQNRLSNFIMDGNVVTSMDVADVSMEVLTLDEHRTVDTSMFGFEAEFMVSDDLVIKADIYQSNSSRDSGGKDTFVVAGSPGAHTGSYKLNEGGLPDYIPTWTEGRNSNDFGNDDFSPHWAAREGSDIEDEVLGYTVDAEWEVDYKSLLSVDFGLSYTSRNKTNTAFDNYSGADGACNYCDYPYTFGQVGADVVIPFPYENFFSGDGANIPRSFPIFSIPGYKDGLAASDGKTLTDYLGNERTFGENESDLWEPRYNPVNSFDITEDTTALYFQANLEGDGWFGNVGARYISTDVTAGYAYNEILSITIEGQDTSNPSWDVVYSDGSSQEATGDYSKFLPAVNFGFYLQEDLLLRLAAGRSLSRPTLEQMAPLTTDDAQSGFFTMEISGNPNIKPVFADQLDMALEWYFDENSLLSTSIFWKELDGFITSNTTNTIIAGESFKVIQPINGDSAEVQGIEVAVQKFFENGFGVTASYAYTDSSTVVDGESAGSLIGVADTSYSLSLIYEKDRISTQIALDYTGDYVVDSYSPLGEDYETTAEAVSMVSASFSYNLTDNAQLFLEGNNLLNEQNRTFQGRSDLPGSLQIYGRTIKFGARYTF